MVGEKFFKYPGSMWVGGPAPFFPTPEAGESNMEIMFPEDGHGFALRQLILFAPRGKLFDREVDLASSYIGGIRFASLHFGSLSQLLKAFPFLLNAGRIMIHLYSKYCDMSHEMAISIMNVSKGSEVAHGAKSACSASAFRLGNRSRMVFHKTSRSIRS
jgi:hypothetical protein